MAPNTDDLKGRAKIAAGAVTGDKDLELEGRMDRATASVKDSVDKVTDMAKEAVDSAQAGAADLVDRGRAAIDSAIDKVKGDKNQ